MLTTGEAWTHIRDSMTDLGTETVTLSRALRRTLRQSVVAERDQPPFDRVTMDGIAIAAADFDPAERRFQIAGTQAAGDPVLVLAKGACIEVMTGAVLPVGADTVIPVERITTSAGAASIESDYAFEPRQFVHPRGSDHAENTQLLTSGRRISALDIGVIASCGLAQIRVSRMPRVSVLSTGNELVPAGGSIAAHQIRLSNGPSISAMLGSHDFDDCVQEHITDDPVLLKQRIDEHLRESDVVILSGGVSMGKADYVPQVLSDLGVKQVFHKVSQRPGKPLWFGVSRDNKPVFALPGNPVSSLVCTRQYVIPALAIASASKVLKEEFSVLDDDVTFTPSLTCFLPVKLATSKDGVLQATPIHTNTSGDFTALAGTDGYVELPLQQTRFPAGSVLRTQHW